MDWSLCPDVESKPGVLGGRPVIKNTRVPPETLLDFLDEGFTLCEIVTDHFPTVPLSRAEGVIRFAHQHEAHPA